MSTISTTKLQELLAKISTTTPAEKANLASLNKLIATEKPTVVDLTSIGIQEGTEDHDETLDILKEVINTSDQHSEQELPREEQCKTTSKETNTQLTVQQQSIIQEPTTRVGVARTVVLNTKQAEFRDKVLTGEDIILIGAAGTGKTTSMRQTTRAIIDSDILPRIPEGTKVLPADCYGMAIVSFTRKAVNNIRHAVVDELKSNTVTLHKLLEFQPEFYQTEDDTGKLFKTMRFLPKRNAQNPLPASLAIIAFEEASMISVDLYELLQEAMPHPHQEIFLGDIQQLPPTFGLAILGFKMLELPIIELTEVYRQALDNPILDCAWKLLAGDPTVFSGALVRDVEHKDKKRVRAPALDALSRKQFDKETGEVIGQLSFQIWQKPLDDVQGVIIASTQFNYWADTGYYNPLEDIILCPYNKAFGTIELNNRISQHQGAKRGAIVYEVIAGFDKHYLAVGDRVLYDKEDAFIVNIGHNSDYSGVPPQPASKNLDRWGAYQEKISEAERLEHEHALEHLEEQDYDLAEIMQTMAAEVEDRVKVASHGITIRYSSTDEEQVLTTAGEINNLLGGYAITVHKFQGSEADRVFIVLHNSHAKMVSRELLYTAVTRAKRFLHIICEPKSFYNGITSQRIKGNTLAEKALKFTGARDEREALAKQKELAAREKEIEEARRWRTYTSPDYNTAQDRLKEKAVEQVSKDAALETLVTSSKPILTQKATYDFKTGKIIWGEQPTYAKDVISDPAEELPEPRMYSLPEVSGTTSPVEKPASKLEALRLKLLQTK